MEIFLMILVVVLFLILTHFIINIHREHQELQYLTDMLHKIQQEENENRILIPTNHKYIKEHLVEVNNLLDHYYARKQAYHRKEIELSKVLTNLSHDIRTPITILKGNSEILLKQIQYGQESETLYQTALKLDQKADELIANVNDYFLLSKLSSGDLLVETTRTNIVKLCNDTVLEYYDQLTQMDFQVEVLQETKPIWINTDPVLLGRILKNIIDNVISHGYAGKYLGIAVCEDTEYVKLMVEDHGQGIAEQNMEHIFERTYTTASKATGNGLGLAIVLQLVGQLHGEIHAQSIPYEKTVFTVTLHR